MLATGVTASTWVGTMFTNTTVTGTDMPPLLAGLLVVCHLKNGELSTFICWKILCTTNNDYNFTIRSVVPNTHIETTLVKQYPHQNKTKRKKSEEEGKTKINA